MNIAGNNPVSVNNEPSIPFMNKVAIGVAVVAGVTAFGYAAYSNPGIVSEGMSLFNRAVSPEPVAGETAEPGIAEALGLCALTLVLFALRIFCGENANDIIAQGNNDYMNS